MKLCSTVKQFAHFSAFFILYVDTTHFFICDLWILDASLYLARWSVLVACISTVISTCFSEQVRTDAPVCVLEADYNQSGVCGASQVITDQFSKFATTRN